MWGRVGVRGLQTPRYTEKLALESQVRRSETGVWTGARRGRVWGISTEGSEIRTLSELGGGIV